jgi:hypothetical protein
MKAKHIKPETIEQLLDEWAKEIRPLHPAIDIVYFHAYSLN